MTDFEAWVTEALEDRWEETLAVAYHANRVFGSWDAYIASLPARAWVRTANGWASGPRPRIWAAI